MANKNMTTEFAPKGAEILQAEVLEDLGLTEYEGNEEVVDRVVARRQKDEEFKANIHGQKKGLQEKENKRIEAMKKAGLDPETGEKLGSNEPAKANSESKAESLSLKDIRALQSVHDDDVDFVQNWAKANNLSVADSVRNKDVQFILRGHEEERKTAEATVTSTQRRNNKTTVNYLEKARNYEPLDDDGMKEAARSFVAELKGKK